MAEDPHFAADLTLKRLAATPARAIQQLYDRTRQTSPVSAADIDPAARVVAPFAVRTPLLSFPVLDERAGTSVFLKPEMLQRTGSFKFRGAFNKLASIPAVRAAAAWSRSPPATMPRAWPRRRRSSACKRPS